jgi:hypothetical protein
MILILPPFFLSFEEPTVNQLNEKQYHIFVRREEKRREG